MNIQKINIFNFNILYKILFEFRENLPFTILQSHNLEDLKKSVNSDNFDKKNVLIVTKAKNKRIIDQVEILQKKTLFLDNSPIEVPRLIERININLIKNNFNFQSNIIIKDYIINLNSKILTKNTKNLKVTEKEIKIILFLNKENKEQNIDILQKEVWGHSSKLDTHTVETHIYRLRKKIKTIFNDESFILSNGEGYFIQ
jgi:DNA-binding response OmpR family regulator